MAADNNDQPVDEHHNEDLEVLEDYERPADNDREILAEENADDEGMQQNFG